LNNEGHPNPTCRGADVPVLGFHSILHITEAFRLLRKSIIHVETEDINNNINSKIYIQDIAIAAFTC
jgi:hypothetical protein